MPISCAGDAPPPSRRRQWLQKVSQRGARGVASTRERKKCNFANQLNSHVARGVHVAVEGWCGSDHQQNPAARPLFG